MTPSENLDEQIKDIILVNGDIDIDDYPSIIKDALELGISRNELSRRASKIFAGLDLSPYRRIDAKLEKNMLQGSISNNEAEEIIEGASNELQRPKVINYMLATIKQRGFSPREKNSFEADSFKNLWMTDEAWAKYQYEKNEVEWLGEKAHSLIELGEISYRKTTEAKYYLRNANYLVPSITTLTKSASKADEFSKIIENEPDTDKRYLKVLYLLNPALPFRLNDQDFANINLLFNKTATDYNLFIATSESYNNRYIHIWLNQTDLANADKLTSGWDFNNFLQFLYKINIHHPFYLNSIKFDKPDQLMKQAETDVSLWIKIADAAENQQLTTWFAGIGQNDLIDKYNKYKSNINGYEYYTEEDKKLAVVNYLINAVNPQLPDPKIESDQREIKLLSIEGNKLVHHTISLKLVNTGFAKAVYYFQNPVNGITLSHNSFTFWSQNNTKADAVTVAVDASQLVRDKLYTVNLFINTEFERLTIPVEVKVVLPLKAYLTQLFKYSIFGGIFFALIRYVTGVLAGNASWFVPESTDLPQKYFSYFISLVLFLGGLVGAVFLIKRIEKI